MLPWLWYRLVVTPLIGPLAWEPPYAAGTALKRQKGKKKKKKKTMEVHSELEGLMMFRVVIAEALV